jgi:hypothetical protein
MTTYTEAARGLEFLLWEQEEGYSREQVTLTASQGALLAGTVMAKVTGTGNYVPYDDDANGTTAGTGIAAGILCYDVANSGSTQPVVIIARQAIVKSALLVWEASNDSTEKAAAVVELTALGILVR